MVWMARVWYYEMIDVTNFYCGEVQMLTIFVDQSRYLHELHNLQIY